jgi:hypothetical protein
VQHTVLPDMSGGLRSHTHGGTGKENGGMGQDAGARQLARQLTHRLFDISGGTSVALVPPIRFSVGDCVLGLSKVCCDPRTYKGGDTVHYLLSVPHHAEAGVTEIDDDLRGLVGSHRGSYISFLQSSDPRYPPSLPVRCVRGRTEAFALLPQIRALSEGGPIECQPTTAWDIPKGTRVACQLSINCLSVNQGTGALRPQVVAEFLLVDRDHIVKQWPGAEAMNYIPFRTQRQWEDHSLVLLDCVVSWRENSQLDHWD